ncbi:hypothetical protein, partial [Cronobacter dublinensis]|uniref:hypothetical protein n=1 Tax=Cronobacter dublinensis TaxID=413497 RepID=UPI001F3A2630
HAYYSPAKPQFHLINLPQIIVISSEYHGVGINNRLLFSLLQAQSRYWRLRVAAIAPRRRGFSRATRFMTKLR